MEANSDGAVSPERNRLCLRGVRVEYGGTRAVDGVDLGVGAGGRRVVALLGPSGCGKSTLLRAIAGIEPLASGSVAFDGVDLGRTPAHRRGFGLVFQDGQLFPHRSVAANIAYGLRGPYGRPLMSRSAREERVAELLELVGLPGFGARSVDQLSGGQAQRVALARALAPRPRLLLLDEPLSSLDRQLRDRLAEDIARILRVAGTPALLVTHDHGEASVLADSIAIMRDGRIVQDAAPSELWRWPRDRDIARFLGYPAFVDGVVEAGVASTPLGTVPLAHPDGPVRLGLRAESVRIAPMPPMPSVPAMPSAPTASPDIRNAAAAPGPGDTAVGHAGGGGDGAGDAAAATVESVTVLPSGTLVAATTGAADRTGLAAGGVGRLVGTWDGCPTEGPPGPGQRVRLELVAGAFAVVAGESVREVAAGAVLDGGRVLLAQRTYPEDLAGLWEFPGGKVEQGETGPVGLRRELAEELGIEVRVGRRLEGQFAVDEPDRLGGGGAEADVAGRFLRLYIAESVRGRPQAREHTALRWVGAGDLDRMPLAPADRLWVPQLQQILRSGDRPGSR